MGARALLTRTLLAPVATVGLLASLCGPVSAAEPPPTIGEQYVLDVASGSATLSAQLNPEGSDTTYRFEYGLTASYGSSTPTKDAGSGTASVLVEAHLQELLTSTTYHYRLVATNSGGTVEGADQTFTTQGIGGQLTLLDGRQWEVVSPQEKQGAGIQTQPREGGMIQAAEDGNAIAYLVTNPIDNEPEGSRALELSQVMGKRVFGGWLNRTINTPHEEVELPHLGNGSEYQLFSSDVSRGLLEQRAFMPLAPGVTENTPYIRDEAACEAKTNGCYIGLVTPEDKKPGAENYGLREISGSSDLSHVVLSSVATLTNDAPEGLYGAGLYEWSGGQLRFVGIQPESEGGKAVNGVLGFENINVRHTISDDGSRIVWRERCGGACYGPLYLRDMAREETVRLDPEGSYTVLSQFEDATADGAHVFFTAAPEGSNERHLYSCEIVETAGRLACNRSKIADEAEGVLGIGEDGRSVYFTSNLALAPGAQPTNCSLEACNLYAARFNGTEWTTRFIAALGVRDHNDWSTGSSIVDMTARVSSNGRFLAFMSEQSLTSYDNRDAASGELDEEVFLYDSDTQALACASCNPTGARPNGLYTREFGEWPLIDTAEAWSKRWLAGNIPAYNKAGLAAPIVRQPRYLSDSGRLFFNATDPLVPQDINGLADVYEYEPDGAGSCARSDGCVDLISGGSSREESAFLDASASGDDVFFVTSARLAADDQDTAYDLYDAHVCSTGVPCVTPTVTPPPCDSGDSCKGPPTPQPSIFGQPASATFSGAGNVVPTKASVRHRSAPSRAQRLARALRACRRAHPHNRRKLRACKRHARAKYAVRASRAAENGHNGRGR
jgi:hypothetical protein